MPKNLRFICLVVLVAFNFYNCHTQTTPSHYSHIPTNCGVNNLFFNSSVCNKFQFIYTQAEIATMIGPVTGPISISRIWFRHGGGSSDPSTTLTNLEIKLGHTTLNSPTVQFSNNYNSGAPVTVLTASNYVYTPLIGAAGVPADNWTFIDLQTPFSYNFTDNLCIEISFSNSSGFIVGNFADNGGVPISQYAGSNSATSANGNTARPVFGISGGTAPCPPVNVIPSQNNVTCSGGSNGSATVVASGGTSFSYTWSPTGGSNASANGLSAGTYTCTVTNECGNSTVQSFVITEPEDYQLNATVIQPSCGNNNGCISFNPTPAGTYFYSWPFPTTMIVDSVCDLGPGSYDITINSSNGCPVDTTIILTNTSALNLVANPVISTINVGDTIQLNVTGGNNYTWSPSSGLSCTNCPDPIASPSSNTVYIVSGSDANGCIGEDTVYITVIQEPIECNEIFVPTAFSPTGAQNSENKILCVYGNCFATFSFTIFNRWGEQVFKTQDPSICWNGVYKGELVNPGVYTFLLNATLIDGNNVLQSGNITVLK